MIYAWVRFPSGHNRMCLSVFDGRNIDQHIVPPNRTREFYMKNRVYTHFGQTQDECGADYELDQLYHNNRDTTPAFFISFPMVFVKILSVLFKYTNEKLSVSVWLRLVLNMSCHHSCANQCNHRQQTCQYHSNVCGCAGAAAECQQSGRAAAECFHIGLDWQDAFCDAYGSVGDGESAFGRGDGHGARATLSVHWKGIYRED